MTRMKNKMNLKSKARYAKVSNQATSSLECSPSDTINQPNEINVVNNFERRQN